MAHRSGLCAECTQTLRETCDRDFNTVSSNRTIETFQRAAEDGCFVCRTIWNRTEEHSKSWRKVEASSSVELSYNTFYTPTKDTIRDLVMFGVSYLDPTTRHETTTRFELAPTCSPQIPRLLCPKRLQDSTSSKQTLDQALAWYEECISSHHKCEGVEGVAQRGWLPNRLVDVGVEGNKDWRLVLSSEDIVPQHTECPSYMTFSYRWGSNPKLLLLSSTMDEYRHGKPIDDLPQTFKDFVKVARHFNVRYIWIDCICIIQDSVDDWEQQAPTMASIYSNATCNVAAAAASDPEQGLFTSRVPQNPRDEIVSAAIVSTTATDYYAFVNSSDHFDRQLRPSILRERGWVFQEWFLSPRVLHFTREQAIWECCNGIKKSETFPFNYQWNYATAKSDKIGANDLMAQRGSVPAGSELPGFMSNESLEVWVRLVIRYSGCSLTHPEDKLFAVSGLAKHFLGISGDAYYAGMWRTNLVYQICWRLWKPCPRPTCGYRAPSWSWASVDGQVWVDGQDFFDGQGVDALPPPIPLQMPRTYWTEVVDVKVGTKTEDCTVGITSGFLRVTSYIFDLSYVRLHTRYDDGGNYRITFDGNCWPTVDLFPDTTEDDFGERGSLRLLVLLTDSVIERDNYDDAQWQTRADGLDVEEEGSELSRLATDSIDASADEEAEGPDNESNKDGHLGEGVVLHVAIEDDAMDAEHIVEEGTEYSGEGSKYGTEYSGEQSEDGPEYSGEGSKYGTEYSGEESEDGPEYSGEGSKYGTEYSGEGSEDDPPMSDYGCPICGTADSYMFRTVPATTCLVVKPAETLESVGQKTYRRVGLLRTDSRASARHMLLELVRQSPDSMQEVVLI